MTAKKPGGRSIRTSRRVERKRKKSQEKPDVPAGRQRGGAEVSGICNMQYAKILILKVFQSLKDSPSWETTFDDN
ncbi:GM14865 [Drosophila sechellia]|uniref:GM14865 n=1 Tax=Drosophila sechellia TaxID=7238 RepID=B4IQ88_DROSE|nr:GM14865 [Drosophila sechellia]